jgi:hypothetical protein
VDTAGLCPSVPTILPVAVGTIADGISNISSIVWVSGDSARPGPGPPIAAPLELLSVDLATIQEAVANIEMQLERQLRPEAYGRRRGGYLDRRRTLAGDA